MDTLSRARRSRSRLAPLFALTAILEVSACDDETNEPDPELPSRTTLVPASNSGYVEARTSQIVTDGSPPSYVFDEFNFDEDATISEVGWQGIYCVQTDGAGAPAPTASSFTISRSRRT